MKKTNEDITTNIDRLIDISLDSLDSEIDKL